MKIITNIEQGTPEWHELRSKHLGASDIAVLMHGEHFGKTPLMLWEEKCGLREGITDNVYMKYGRENEEPARQIYVCKRGVVIKPAVVLHENEIMMASLDGLSEDQKSAIEIKCPGGKDHLIAKNGNVPKKYIPQLQHQMSCTGHRKTEYCSYREGEFIIVSVERDDIYIDEIEKKAIEFMERVRKFDPPPKNKYDLKEDKCIERDEKWVEQAKLLEYWKTEQKKLKKKIEELIKELKELSKGESSCGGGYYFKKTIKTGSVDYSSIPELNAIDLGKYRKQDIEQWKLTKK